MTVGNGSAHGANWDDGLTDHPPTSTSISFLWGTLNRRQCGGFGHRLMEPLGGATRPPGGSAR